MGWRCGEQSVDWPRTSPQRSKQTWRKRWMDGVPYQHQKIGGNGNLHVSSGGDSRFENDYRIVFILRVFVLGDSIDAYVCNEIFILQHYSNSTRLSVHHSRCLRISRTLASLFANVDAISSIFRR